MPHQLDTVGLGIPMPSLGRQRMWRKTIGRRVDRPVQPYHLITLLAGGRGWPREVRRTRTAWRIEQLYPSIGHESVNVAGCRWSREARLSRLPPIHLCSYPLGLSVSRRHTSLLRRGALLFGPKSYTTLLFSSLGPWHPILLLWLFVQVSGPADSVLDAFL